MLAACPGATDVVKGLPIDLHVEIIATRRVPAVERFVGRLEEELRPYREASGGRLHVTVSDADEPAVSERARAADLAKIPFDENGRVVWNEASKAKERAFFGIRFTYGAVEDRIEAIDPDASRNIGLSIHLRLRTIRDRGGMVQRKIGVLTGHGEASLSDPLLGRDSVASLIAKAIPIFRFVDVDLRRQPSIDPSLDGLIVLQPKSDLSEDELRAIDRFVLRGHSLVVVTSAVQVRADDTQKADLERHGLDRLLRGYGIEIGNDAVLDETQSLKRREAEAAPSFVVVDKSGLRNASLPLWRTDRLVLPFASSVTVRPDAQPEAALQVLATSSANAEIARTSPLDLSRSPGGTRSPVALAASVEGTLTSAFGKERSAAPARVLAIASAGLWQNPLGGQDANAALRSSLIHVDNDALFALRNTLYWMTVDAGVLRCSWNLASGS